MVVLVVLVVLLVMLFFSPPPTIKLSLRVRMSEQRSKQASNGTTDTSSIWGAARRGMGILVSKFH